MKTRKFKKAILTIPLALCAAIAVSSQDAEAAFKLVTCQDGNTAPVDLLATVVSNDGEHYIRFETAFNCQRDTGPWGYQPRQTWQHNYFYNTAEIDQRFVGAFATFRGEAALQQRFLDEKFVRLEVSIQDMLNNVDERVLKEDVIKSLKEQLKKELLEELRKEFRMGQQ